MTPKFDCAKSFMDTDVFRKFSTKYGLDSETRLEKAVGVSEAVGLRLVPRRCLSALGVA